MIRQVVFEAVKYASYATLEKLIAISKPLAREWFSRALLNALHYEYLHCDQRDNTNRYGEDFNRTISLLITLGGPQLIDAREFLPGWMNHTPLHVACQLGQQERARQIIAKMREGHYSLDTVASGKRTLDRYQPLATYFYPSLHMAIEKGYQQVAVDLIEAGANIHLKAVNEKRSFYWLGLFSSFERIEKNPLEIAIEHKQPQVIRALQRVMLNDYIKAREAEAEYLNQISLFGYVLFRLGYYTLFGYTLQFGYYNKTTKLDEARAFQALLNCDALDSESFERMNQGALGQGRLGKIVQLSNYYLRNDAFTEDNTFRV